MSQPKSPFPVNVPFATRATRDERDAINALIARWDEELMAAGAPPMGDHLTAWFRATVRQLAAANGIAVVESDASDPSAPARASGPQKGGNPARKPR